MRFLSCCVGLKSKYILVGYPSGCVCTVEHLGLSCHVHKHHGWEGLTVASPPGSLHNALWSQNPLSPVSLVYDAVNNREWLSTSWWQPRVIECRQMDEILKKKYKYRGLHKSTMNYYMTENVQLHYLQSGCSRAQE